jgi:hypothetical protein
VTANPVAFLTEKAPIADYPQADGLAGRAAIACR